MTPGFHQIIARTYHMDPCVAPSLSSSIAQILLRESPRKAWFSHPRLNPNYREEHESKFDLGSSAHAVLLENDASKIAVIDPKDYPSKTGSIPDGWTNKAIREARDLARTAGKTPLLKTVYADVRNMVDAALEFLAGKDCELAEFWHGAVSEVTGVWREGDVWLRCRFDRLQQARHLITDYKSTTDASPEVFSRLIPKMGYHIQDAFYRRGARALGLPEPKFAFLTQSCEEPYECSANACHPALQEIADAEVERAIDLWRHCITHKAWPSYGGRIHYAMPTSYMITEHEMHLQEAA